MAKSKTRVKAGPAVEAAKSAKKTRDSEAEAQRLVATLEGIGASQAIVEFEIDGTIITANENFLAALGYQLSEVEGKHHSIFVEATYKESPEYRQFWDDLRAGKFQSGEMMRIHKSGEEVWIQASYNPVLDADGNSVKVVKNAFDITEKKLAALKTDAEAQHLVATLEGIGASQAIVEFEIDGTIITANENFLAALGYQLSEVEGKHHSIFVEATYKESPEYRQFWDDLRAGKFQTGEMMRIHKSGEEVWIQASYNPVLDADGNPVKVVNNAFDITEKKLAASKADKLAQMIQGMPIGVMMCDRDTFEINYMNTFSIETLKTLEEHLPVKVDDIMGQCIDVFHKNPSHQRRILGDPKNLPHKAKIKLGPETLSLEVSAVTAGNGEYLGPMLAWNVITRQVLMAENVKGAVDIVASASTELQSTAQGMSAAAEEAGRQSQAVTAASEQASTNVQTVSAAAEQLSTSISEISRQVTEASRISQSAVEEAERTNHTVQSLSDAAQRIGDVVNLINDIAGQTNLLALNATIEAARAGDAGKGFAVVASEVKNLANQTAKATEDISKQIESIQSETSNAVDAIKRIGTTIGEISEIALATASAVEEQGAATNEISRNVQEAANGTQEVSTNITSVNEAAQQTGKSAEDVLNAAGELSKQGEELRSEIERFLAEG